MKTVSYCWKLWKKLVCSISTISLTLSLHVCDISHKLNTFHRALNIFDFRFLRLGTIIHFCGFYTDENKCEQIHHHDMVGNSRIKQKSWHCNVSFPVKQTNLFLNHWPIITSLSIQRIFTFLYLPVSVASNPSQSFIPLLAPVPFPISHSAPSLPPPPSPDFPSLPPH